MNPLAILLPLVIVSVPPQEWLVEELSHGTVEVRCILPAGADPHTFEPRPSDIEAIEKAECWLTVGLPFEEAIARKVKDRVRLRPVSEVKRGEDPHLWLTPGGMAQIATNSAAALMEFDNKLYAPELARVTAQLLELDALAREKFAQGGTFWVLHPSWTRLAANYGLTQKSLENHSEEISPRALAEFTKAKPKVLFTTPLSAPLRTSAFKFPLEFIPLDPLPRDYPAAMRGAITNISAALER